MAKHVIFFKSRSTEYENFQGENNILPHFIEPLQFNFINESLIRDKLSNFILYNGIIFTSPRAIECTHKLCMDLSGWKTKKIYTVGESSSTRIKTLLNLDSLGQESGNAENLSDLIVSENCKGANFLFPCGNLKSEVLIGKLLKNEISVDAVTVYETCQNIQLKHHLLDEVSKYIPNAFVFFSPSGVDFTFNVMKCFDTDYTFVPTFAIGNSTAKKIESLGMNLCGIAKQPNATSIALMLEQYFFEI